VVWPENQKGVIMPFRADKDRDTNNQPVEHKPSNSKRPNDSSFQFTDNRPDAKRIKALHGLIATSPRVNQLRALRNVIDNGSRSKQDGPNRSPLSNVVASPREPVQKNENATGLPHNLKTGIEELSGYSMDDVAVHYNSGRPSQMRAAAFAQGTDIHIGAGEEQHLPHEAWHVVQQKQGRVAATAHEAGTPINDDVALESEADVMGKKALNAIERRAAPAQKKSLFGGVRQMYARWYEWDGKEYHARWLGLPESTGWIKLEQEYEGKPVWMSITNVAHHPDIESAREHVEEIRKFVDEQTPLIGGIVERVQHTENLVEEVRAVQEKFITVSAALDSYLKSTTTVLKAFGVLFGLTGLVIGAYLISLFTLPAWLIATIDGLSYLYGAGLLYRWMKSDLLPVFLKLPLLLVNGAIMVGAAGIEIGQIIAYLTDLSETMPLQHIQFAAIPFAILVEHLIVILIEKVNAIRTVHNRDRGYSEDQKNE
jgi:hypothetical protein